MLVGCQPEDRQALIDEAALSQQRDVESPSAKLLEKELTVTEARQQHERRSARLQVIAQARSEALRDIARAPGPVTIITRYAAYKRWIEQHEIEPLRRNRPKQVTVPYL